MTTTDPTPACSCAMTEGSQRRCPVHGEDANEEHLLALVVAHDGRAALEVRDDVDLDAALSWLRTAITHVIELRDGPPPVAPPIEPASGTLAP